MQQPAVSRPLKEEEMCERDMGDCYSREGLNESLATTKQAAPLRDEVKQCKDMQSVLLLTRRGSCSFLGGS